MPTTFAWIVLAAVFADELAVVVAFAIWGAQAEPPWLLVWLLPLVSMLTWFLLASPKAKYGGPVVRPVTKVVIFGLATVALWDANHPLWAIALLVFSVVVNGLAQLPVVRAAVDGLNEPEASHDAR